MYLYLFVATNFFSKKLFHNLFLNKNILKTFYNKQTDNTITTLNEELHTNHYTNTGAEKFVSKAHFEVLDIVKSNLKNSIS
jgi:hypothetical protein